MYFQRFSIIQDGQYPLSLGDGKLSMPNSVAIHVDHPFTMEGQAQNAQLLAHTSSPGRILKRIHVMQYVLA